jgi:hypothetical protein
MDYSEDIRVRMENASGHQGQEIQGMHLSKNGQKGCSKDLTYYNAMAVHSKDFWSDFRRG